jgi:hypothetical protein
LGHVVSQQVAVTTPTPPVRDHCPNVDPQPRWLPPDKFHCQQDHYLQSTYGITCDDYWQLYELQDGRCAICWVPHRPSERNLVVDHNHRTGSIDGLCHFGCNRRLHDRLRRYLANPPGRRMGLAVPPDRLAKIERRYAAKREAWRRDHPPTPPAPVPTDDYHAKVAAALEATKQGA